MWSHIAKLGLLGFITRCPLNVRSQAPPRRDRSLHRVQSEPSSPSSSPFKRAREVAGKQVAERAQQELVPQFALNRVVCVNVGVGMLREVFSLDHKRKTSRTCLSWP
eukprot:6100154-Amphidinium_carterae.1